LPLTEPIQWTEEQLAGDLRTAIEAFRNERMQEPLEAYLKAFDRYREVMHSFLVLTSNLTRLEDHAGAILAEKDLLNVFRYLSGPPISSDDLKVLAEAPSFNSAYLKKNPDVLKRIVQVVWSGLDRRRFPWIFAAREPTAPEREQSILSSAALIASNIVMTARRQDLKSKQEKKVEDALIAAGFKRVRPRKILTLAAAPNRGEFCGESILGTRKADLVVRLWDDRVMPIECKVSNSAINSVKRLNNDAAVKAGIWRTDFGATQVVPTAVLSGVYKLHNLVEAQARRAQTRRKNVAGPDGLVSHSPMQIGILSRFRDFEGRPRDFFDSRLRSPIRLLKDAPHRGKPGREQGTREILHK
jgi:hypothetical protein